MGVAQTKFKIQNSKFKITMKVFLIFSIIILFLLLPQISFAQSNYVLPYPSSMPGSLFYKGRLVFEEVSKYWYFGAFGQFNYNLKMADKYLVEAKTLFEYKQYLLAYNALKKSDSYFVNILPQLIKAAKQKKDTTWKRNILKGAVQKHIEILEKIEAETPDTFIWQPEKTLPTTLYLQKEIIGSVLLRKKSL